MKCSPGGTFATLNRPSGPAIVRPRIDIAASAIACGGMRLAAIGFP